MKRKRDSIATDSQKGNGEAENVGDPEIQRLVPSFTDIPCAITSDILLRLPMKSVLICRCVCTSWNTLISDPQFVKLHFKRAPVDVLIRTNDPKRVSRTLHLLEFESERYENHFLSDEDEDGPFCYCEDFAKPNCNSHMKLEAKFKIPLRDAKMALDKILESKNGGSKRRYIACKPRNDKFAVVNSCNGLLCLCDPKDRDPLVVCNPVTGEFIRLPEASRVKKLREPFYCGFGFHKKTNEYKVIRLFRQYVLDPDFEFYDCTFAEMHTLGTGTWRSIGIVPYRINVLKFPTCLKGALHWLAFMGMKGSILSFNLKSDRFQSFPSPPRVLDMNGMESQENTFRVLDMSGMKSRESISMGELRGYLYICDASACPIKLWVMKNYGVEESWTKVFNIDTDGDQRWPYGFCRPIKLFNKGDAILMYHSCNCLTYHDRRKSGFKCFKVGATKIKFEAIAHIPSFFSLKDVVKGDNVEVLNVHSRCAAFKLWEENDVLFLAEDNVQLGKLYEEYYS